MLICIVSWINEALSLIIKLINVLLKRKCDFIKKHQYNINYLLLHTADGSAIIRFTINIPEFYLLASDIVILLFYTIYIA